MLAFTNGHKKCFYLHAVTLMGFSPNQNLEM